jgi:hypothetical protein
MDDAETDDGVQRSDSTVEWRNLTGTLRLVGALGFTIVAAVVGGFLAGLWASRRLSLGAWPIVVGVVAGVVLSSLWAYRLLTNAVMSPRRHEGGAQGERTR